MKNEHLFFCLLCQIGFHGCGYIGTGRFGIGSYDLRCYILAPSTDTMQQFIACTQCPWETVRETDFTAQAFIEGTEDGVSLFQSRGLTPTLVCIARFFDQETSLDQPHLVEDEERIRKKVLIVSNVLRGTPTHFRFCNLYADKFAKRNMISF